jgi:hypothetical protein
MTKLQNINTPSAIRARTETVRAARRRAMSRAIAFSKSGQTATADRFFNAERRLYNYARGTLPWQIRHQTARDRQIADAKAMLAKIEDVLARRELHYQISAARHRCTLLSEQLAKIDQHDRAAKFAESARRLSRILVDVLPWQPVLV